MTLVNFYLNIYPQITEFFLLIVVFFLLLFSVILNNSYKKSFPILIKNTSFLFIQTLIQTLILLINFNPIFMINWNNLLIFDSFVFYTKIIIIIFINFWFFSFFTKINKLLNFEFWILILLSLVAAFFVIQVNDLLSVYISIEFLSLIFYILASLKRNSEFSTEAGLKYFILGAFSSGLLLFGLCFLYSLTGITNFQDFILFFTGFYNLQNSFLTSGIILSLFFILTSFLFKLGSAPFHFWLPDVYEGSPISITSFFIILPKIVLITLIIRFFYVVSLDFLINKISLFILVCTFLSSLIGTLGAFQQKKWKRFIAYSSISHLSFLLINICSINLSNLSNLIFYLIFYLVMTISFFVFFTFFNTLKINHKTQNNRFLSSLKFLNITNPLAASSLSIILFSLAGIPPLTGFFVKFFVLFSAISQKFISLVIFILFFNCISCFYYIRIIQTIYFTNQFFKIKLPIILGLPYLASLVLGILTFLLLFASFNFEFFYILANLMCISFSY